MTILKVNRSAIGSSGHLTHIQFTWTTIVNRPVKLADIVDIRNLHHLSELSYPPQLAVSFRAPDQLILSNLCTFHCMWNPGERTS